MTVQIGYGYEGEHVLPGIENVANSYNSVFEFAKAMVEDTGVIHPDWFGVKFDGKEYCMKSHGVVHEGVEDMLDALSKHVGIKMPDDEMHVFIDSEGMEVYVNLDWRAA